jgi:hypothetical protein
MTKVARLEATALALCDVESGLEVCVEYIEKSVCKAPEEEKDGHETDGQKRLFESEVLSTGDCIVALNSLCSFLLDYVFRKWCNDGVIASRHSGSSIDGVE